MPGLAGRATASRTTLADERREGHRLPLIPSAPPGAAVDPIGCRAAIAPDHGDAAATQVLVIPIPRIP